MSRMRGWDALEERVRCLAGERRMRGCNVSQKRGREVYRVLYSGYSSAHVYPRQPLLSTERSTLTGRVGVAIFSWLACREHLKPCRYGPYQIFKVNYTRVNDP